MLQSKDHTPAGDALMGSESSLPSSESGSSIKSGSGSKSRKNSGSSNSKRNARIKTLKKVFFLGMYAGLMLVSVSRMMDEQLMPSFWLDLLAFAVLWVYYALSSLKLIRLFRISKMWFFSHALVILFHLAVALLIGDVDPNAGVPKPIHEPNQTQPVVQPYEGGD